MKKIIAILCAVLMVVSMTACGSGDAKYTIGICQFGPRAALDEATEGFKQAVEAELGKDVEFVVKSAEGDPAACAAIVEDFVADDVDLILANGEPALQAAAAATTEIPILATSVTDYASVLGIENFSGTVGGNISGTSDWVEPLDNAVALLEWNLEVQNVGVIYCASDATSKAQAEAMVKYLTDAGITCQYFPFNGADDVASVAQSACASSEMIYLPSDYQVALNAKTIDSVCRPAKVPVFAAERGICADCGVATLSIDYSDLGAATGKMAVQVLTGAADISTMPIESASPQQQYNEAICTELGMEIPLGYNPMA